MNENVKKVGGIVLGLAKLFVPQIAQAEEVVKGFKKGSDRRKAVVDAVILSPVLAEVLSGHEIVNDELWREALGDMNDAVFKMQRAIREKDAPAPAPDAPAE